VTSRDEFRFSNDFLKLCSLEIDAEKSLAREDNKAAAAAIVTSATFACDIERPWNAAAA